jgi:hypothetical protein
MIVTIELLLFSDQSIKSTLVSASRESFVEMHTRVYPPLFTKITFES